MKPYDDISGQRRRRRRRRRFFFFSAVTMTNARMMTTTMTTAETHTSSTAVEETCNARVKFASSPPPEVLSESNPSLDPVLTQSSPPGTVLQRVATPAPLCRCSFIISSLRISKPSLQNLRRLLVSKLPFTSSSGYRIPRVLLLMIDEIM